MVKTEAMLEGITPEILRQLGLGTQLAKAIRKVTPQESMTKGMRDIFQQLESATVQVCEISEDDILVNQPKEWPEVSFEVALDSGSVVHVRSNEDALGYLLEPSAGSRRGQKFMMGAPDQNSELQSVFQIAAVTRPLMSVG